MSFNIEEHFNRLQEKGNVILAYKGPISTDVINGTLEQMESSLDAMQKGKVKKKIYNVLVESLQNLYHHVDEAPEDLKDVIGPRFGIIMITEKDDVFRISCGNFINSSKIKFLKDKIDKINSLSKEELKEMYKFILNHQKLSAKGGGGLGLVDIARKTGNNLEYSFYEHKGEHYFFNLDIFVN